MRHCTYLFLGEELEECATLITQNILRDGNDEQWQHFNALLWNRKEDEIEIKEFVHYPIDETQFFPDDTYLYQIKGKPLTPIPVSDNKKQVSSFFGDNFQTHVSNNGKMLLNIILRASDKLHTDLAKTIICLLGEKRPNYDIDILLIAPDIYPLFFHDEELCKKVKESIHEENKNAYFLGDDWISFRKEPEARCLQQIILLQNRRKGGGSFNFDISALSRIISEYALTCIENYEDIFDQSTAIQMRKEGKIAGIGISCLDFNRSYYLNYMLHHAYLHIMRREGVKQDVADVNKVAQIATETLASRINVLTNFYNKYIQSEIDKGKSGDEIVRKGLNSQMDEFISEMEAAITNHIKDENLTLPEKSALMAQILLKDEDMLSGYLYNKDQPAYLDLFREPVNFFIEHYNNSLEFEKDEEGNIVRDEETGIPVIKDAIISGPQDDEGYIKVPFEKLRKLRMDIQQGSEFIRQRSEELLQLEQSQEAMRKADDVVVEDDNYFKRFKLIGDDIQEDPLQDNYEPVATKETNIDLSHDFTPIKNQGPVGACTTFAVTAVYEYILKKNDRADHDLSERFLYYNAREADGRLDKEGVAISTAIRSIGDNGICSEEKWPFSFDEYNTKPSDEAYQDAVSRKIKKALNIVLTDNQDENRDALRSAISEGYPVIISLNLFDAFDHIGSDGMVPVPSPGDLILQRDDAESRTSSPHAMVACGYDDKNQVFLVRNSWGERFGKNGYCYIPYAYICNHEHLNHAYIITEVTDDSIKVRGVKGRYKVMLDLNDIGVKIGLARYAIAAKKKEQEQLVAEYNAIYSQFMALMEALRNPSVREEIVGITGEHYSQRVAELIALRKQTENKKSIELDNYDKVTTSNQVKGWAIFGGAAIILGVITYYFGYWENITIPTCVALGIGAIALIRYAFYRKNKRFALEAALDDEIAANNQKLVKARTTLTELDYRQHVAGMILDNIVILNNNLQSLQTALYNFVKNLSAWYDEESEKVLNMSPEERPPFIALLDNLVLDSFFEKMKEDLTKDIRLYKIWSGNYMIDNMKILSFKNSLKQQIKDALSKSLDGFNVYEYLAGIRHYPYLTDHQEKDLRSEHISKLNDYSMIFLLPVNNNPMPAAHHIYVRCEETFVQDWRDLCKRNTEGGASQCGNISSPFKVLEIQLEYVCIDNITIFAS